MGFPQASSFPCFQLHFDIWKVRTKLPQFQQAAVKAMTEGDLLPPAVCADIRTPGGTGHIPRPLVKLCYQHKPCPSTGCTPA